MDSIPVMFLPVALVRGLLRAKAHLDSCDWKVIFSVFLCDRQMSSRASHCNVYAKVRETTREPT